ncbi:MAG: hypothetical protein HY519_03695 [Candidatus Aenigmarchaeota archaeon]|nr:hypothetical protein [Candidatus Aenigmarchaeota archaeon]
MVKQDSKNGNSVFVCEACGFAYREQAWAEKCQAWCAKHKSCNVLITRHAVQ